MNATRSGALFLLLLVLGTAVLWSGGGIGGPETAVQQYTAFAVSHEDGELVLTDVDSGEERRGTSASITNVDEDIVCLPTGTRECTLASKEYGGEINSTGASSTFQYAYLDDEFYRIRATNEFEFEYERTDASDALAAVAFDSNRLTPLGRDVLDEGEVTSTRSMQQTNELVERDGRYYTILRTGSKVYGDSGSTCSSGGDGFCERADAERWGNWIRTRGLGILGIAVGGCGLLRTFWPERFSAGEPGA